MYGQSNVNWTQPAQNGVRVAYHAPTGRIFVQGPNGTQAAGWAVPPPQTGGWAAPPPQAGGWAAPPPQAPKTKVKFGRDQRGRAVKIVTTKYPDGRKKTKEYHVSRTEAVCDRWGRPIQSIWYWEDGTTTKKAL